MRYREDLEKVLYERILDSDIKLPSLFDRFKSFMIGKKTILNDIDAILDIWESEIKDLPLIWTFDDSHKLYSKILDSVSDYIIHIIFSDGIHEPMYGFLSRVAYMVWAYTYYHITDLELMHKEFMTEDVALLFDDVVNSVPESTSNVYPPDDLNDTEIGRMLIANLENMDVVTKRAIKYALSMRTNYNSDIIVHMIKRLYLEYYDAIRTIKDDVLFKRGNIVSYNPCQLAADTAAEFVLKATRLINTCTEMNVYMEISTCK